MCTNVTGECVIGELYNYDNTQLVNPTQLKSYIQQNIDLENSMYKEFALLGYRKRRVYSLADYCDKRKTTNLIRFKFCPCCGQEIDWKKIKEG